MIGLELRPWTLAERVVCWLVMDGNRTVATIDKPYGEEKRAEAEAKLSAAAPEMRKALEPFAREYRDAGADHLRDEALLRDADEFNELTIGDMRRALAAFEKAGGRL